MKEPPNKDLLLAAALHTFTSVISAYAKAQKNGDYSSIVRIGDTIFSLIDTLACYEDIEKSWEAIFNGSLNCSTEELEKQFRENFKLTPPPGDKPNKDPKPTNPEGYFE